MGIPRPSILILSFSLLSLHLSLTSSSSSFSPADNYLINCGSNDATIFDSYHRKFIGDESSDSDSVVLEGGHAISVTNTNRARDLSPIYHASKVFTIPSKYVFKIKDKGIHFVRLHFQLFDSLTFDPVKDAQFHVVANGYVLLNNFTGMSFKESKTEIKEYILHVDYDELDILFVPLGKSNFAFVSAIEVISAPKDLILDLAQSVESNGIVKIDGLCKYGLETVHRVNVGGSKVTPFNDTLWRTWVPDEEFLVSKDGTWKVRFTGRIIYVEGGASQRVVPDNICNSARVISSSSGKIAQSNVTWRFPVIGGYKYLVRTHFCDIASIGPNLLYFNVYVNGYIAYENLDASALSNGMLGSPFYTDFVVDGSSSGNLTVSVGPSNFSDPKGIDAILNGVEIFKLSNSVRSFNGEVSVNTILENLPTRNIGVLMPMIAALCLLVAASVALHRRMFGSRESMAWTRLPVEASEINLKSGR